MLGKLMKHHKKQHKPGKAKIFKSRVEGVPLLWIKIKYLPHTHSVSRFTVYIDAKFVYLVRKGRSGLIKALVSTENVTWHFFYLTNRFQVAVRLFSNRHRWRQNVVSVSVCRKKFTWQSEVLTRFRKRKN